MIIHQIYQLTKKLNLEQILTSSAKIYIRLYLQSW